MERRAQLGRDRRERDRLRRERRRQGPANQDAEDAEDAADIHENEADNLVQDQEDGLSQHERERRRRERAESIPWDDEERWRPENFNVAPRSNCPVIVMRSMAARMRGGGSDVESQGKPEEEAEDAINIGDQVLGIETM